MKGIFTYDRWGMLQGFVGKFVDSCPFQSRVVVGSEEKEFGAFVVNAHGACSIEGDYCREGKSCVASGTVHVIVPAIAALTPKDIGPDPACWLMWAFSWAKCICFLGSEIVSCHASLGQSICWPDLVGPFSRMPLSLTECQGLRSPPWPSSFEPLWALAALGPQSSCSAQLRYMRPPSARTKSCPPSSQELCGSSGLGLHPRLPLSPGLRGPVYHLLPISFAAWPSLLDVIDS